MIYAQYFHNSTGWNGKDFSGPVKPIEMCGSEGVALFDGRLAMRNVVKQARAHAAKLNTNLNKGIVGFTINTGESFTRSREVRALELFQ